MFSLVLARGMHLYWFQCRVCTVPTMCNVCTALMIRRVCTAPIIHNILPVLSQCSSVINRVHCASPAPTSRPISWANLIKDTKKASKGSSFFPYSHLSFAVNKWYFLLNKGSKKRMQRDQEGFAARSRKVRSEGRRLGVKRVFGGRSKLEESPEKQSVR